MSSSYGEPVLGAPEGRQLCKRLSIRRGLEAGGANLIAAVFVFLYLGYLAPDERVARPVSQLHSLVVFIVFVLVAGAICGSLGDRRLHLALRWLHEGRPPTPDERAATLALPWRGALGDLPTWIIGSLFFSLTSLPQGHTDTHVIKVMVTILLGGVLASSVDFLLAERGLRPAFALVLAGEAPRRPATLGLKARLMLSWALAGLIPLLGIILLPLAAHHATARANVNGAIVVLAIAGIAVGLLISVVVAKSVAEPMDDVRRALRRVQAGHLDVEVPVDDGGEVGMLQAGVNHMVAGLRERQRLADLFGRHVGAEVAQRALEQGSGLASEQREASVLFVDIVGSTAMTEVLAPEGVVATLNAMFGAVVHTVTGEGGWVNKFEGDGALCVFGAPVARDDFAACALRAARALHARLVRELPEVDAGIGVSAGAAVAGNVGAEQRFEYTVIGDPVNEAARLCERAKGAPGRVLASEAVLTLSGDEAARWQLEDEVLLRGRPEPTRTAAPLAA
jgi:adenylate cyclase